VKRIETARAREGTGKEENGVREASEEGVEKGQGETNSRERQTRF
jgi:hypothetical protein